MASAQLNFWYLDTKVSFFEGFSFAFVAFVTKHHLFVVEPCTTLSKYSFVVA